MKIRGRTSRWGVGLVAALGICAALPASPAPARKAGVKLIPLTVARVGTVAGKHVVILEAKGGNTLLPIWIGLREAQAIQLGLSNLSPPRPFTHNLLESVIKSLGAKITRVAVIDIRNNVFIGQLTVKDRRRRLHRIDARPSDLCALAADAKLKVWVAPKVLKQAGMQKPKPTKAGSGKFKI